MTIRLKVARKMGATQTINNSKEEGSGKGFINDRKQGADAVIEAVGIPETFELCQLLVAAGGRIANVGVHGKGI